MTLADLQAYVGAPSLGGDTFQRVNGQTIEWGWRDEMNGLDGWWWAVTAGACLLAIGWTAGDELERGEEIRRAVIRHVKPRAA